MLLLLLRGVLLGPLVDFLVLHGGRREEGHSLFNFNFVLLVCRWATFRCESLACLQRLVSESITAGLAMDVKRLSKEELLYEVGIRGQRFGPNESTVKDLRRMFIDLKLREDAGEELEDALVPVDVAEEATIVQAKLTDATSLLDAMLETEDAASNSSNAARVRTLTSHCNKRLQRLLSHAEGEERKVVKPLFTSLKGIVEEFRKRGNTPIYSATSVPSVSSFSKSSRREEEREDSDSDGERKSHKSSKRGQVPKDLHKWGIKFSGDDDSSVTSFILDVEEKAAWKGVHLDQLLVGVSEFFTGEAKTWYRSIKNKVDSWEEMKIALRREFLALDYFDNLWEEIRGRKQGLQESVGTFIANMLAMFDRLSMDEPITEELMLKIILKNLAPFYTERLALTDVLSLKHLRVLGKQLETSKMRVDSYDSKGKVKKMEPEFAAKPTRIRKPVITEVSEVAVGSSSSKEIKKPESKGEGSSSAKSGHPKMHCWRCEKPGHRHVDCTSDVNRVFCYRCGMKDVTVRNCGRCRRKGEDQ